MENYGLYYKGLPVYDKEENFLGDIEGILFSVVKEKIVGFVYKKHFLSYDYFLLEEIIQKNDKGKIYIHKIPKNGQNNMYYEIIGKLVKTQEGNDVGIINDLEFDANWNLVSIIVDCFYTLSSIEIVSTTRIRIKNDVRKIHKNHIISYFPKYVVVENILFSKEKKKTLENISKFFINIPNPI